MAEIRVRRAGGDDQIVVSELGAIHEVQDLARGIDPIHFAEQHLHVGLVAQDPSNRRRDVTRRQDRHRHLIQQRLENVMIASIEERHIDARLAQARAAFRPPNPRQ